MPAVSNKFFPVIIFVVHDAPAFEMKQKVATIGDVFVVSLMVRKGAVAGGTIGGFMI